MKKLLILSGLPASGKSSHAKELLNKEPNKWKRVNKDDLRLMLDDEKWGHDNEKFVLKMRDIMTVSALKNGYNVIIDDTNLHPKHKQRMEQLIREYKDIVGEVEIEEKFLDVPVNECIKRDLARPNSVGQAVILDMYNKYLAPKNKYIPPKDSVPLAIIVDMDNTLSMIGERSPFDWDKVDIDTVNESVKLIVNKMAITHKVIILSGRDGVCRKKTEHWLEKNEIKYDYIFMRSEKDNRPDEIIKKELFDKYIRDKYNVMAVFDDRLKVCRMWYHELGLPLFRVGNPDADF